MSLPSAGYIAVIDLDKLLHTAIALTALFPAAEDIRLVLLALLVQLNVPWAGQQSPLVVPPSVPPYLCLPGAWVVAHLPAGPGSLARHLEVRQVCQEDWLAPVLVLFL